MADSPGRARRRTKSKRLVEMFVEQEGRCFYCTVLMSFDVAPDASTRATTDHKIPLARGGTNHRRNVVAACFRCNHRKGNMTVEEFVGGVLTEEDLNRRRERAALIPPQFEAAKAAAERAVIHGQRIGVLTQEDHDLWNRVMGND
jgi:5-methylcytosine-specific restriction endonuclease McrA